MSVRIGIDVGGTFTDGVMLDARTGELLAALKIPTTHDAPDGVAEGVRRVLEELCERHALLPGDVAFIAHGTTQATNALLEGDVALVAVVGMGTGIDRRAARWATDLGTLELAPGKRFAPAYRFLDSSDASTDNTKIDAILDELRDAGVRVVVASGAYATDDPQPEDRVVCRAREKGFFATSGHMIVDLYGLKRRTLTAAINGALIPKMLETARCTEQAVRDAGIGADLMVMRADAGVMTTRTMGERPILTLLSGLSAGVAGALMHAKMIDGLFFEVGGTSTDVSVIRMGRAATGYARVGGHSMGIKAVDVRTIGLGGGSMIRFSMGNIVGVGPRSAHLARLAYECHSEIDPVDRDAETLPELLTISPCLGDPDDYVVLRCASGRKYALTLAGAANVLGLVPEGDYARGNMTSARWAWDAFGGLIGVTGQEAARRAMGIAQEKMRVLVEGLLKEHQLERSRLRFVGGGGAASVLVPALASRFGVPVRVLENAPYISAIGVATALLREHVERSVVNPNERDVRSLREHVEALLLESGARPETIEVHVEVDRRKNVLSCTGTGAQELRTPGGFEKTLSDDELLKTLAPLFDEPPHCCVTLGKRRLYEGVAQKTRFWGLLRERARVHVLVESDGTLLLESLQGRYRLVKAADARGAASELGEELSFYSDAGGSLPKIRLATPTRLHDYAGLTTPDQLLAMLAMDLERISPDQEVLLIAEPR